VELSAWDIGQIRRLQIKRWRDRFPVLAADSLQHISISDNCLNLHCETQQVAAEAIVYGALLTKASGLILAVEAVKLWLNNELLWEAEVSPFSEGVESGETSVDPEPMPTATLDRPSSTTANAKTIDKRLPGQNLEAIASDLEIGVDELRTWLESNGAVVIPYGNDEVVTGEMAILAYQQFEKSRLQRVMQRRGLLVEDSFTQNGTAATAIAPAPVEAPTKPARKTSTRKPAATAGKKTEEKKTTTRATRKPATKARKPRSQKSSEV